MNVDLIRSVDKWLGVPACFLLTVLNKLKSTLRNSRERCPIGKSHPPKILFIELSEMGSAIVAYPAMKYMLRKFPNARLYFLTFSQNRFSVEILNVIPPNQIITIDMDHSLGFIHSTFLALKKIRGERMDMVFDLELFSRFSALISGLSDAQVRVGYGKYHEEGLYRGGVMTHKVFYNCHQHMAKNFLALVKAAERSGEYPLVKEAITEGDIVRPSYEAPAGAVDDLRHRLAKVCPMVGEASHLILLNPSAGRLLPIRAWPLMNYVALSRNLIEQLDVAIVLIGLADAREETSEVCFQVNSGRCLDLAGQTSFNDLMNLFCLADVLVTADSGPAHFAALTSVERFILFGPETPALYRPFGSRTHCFFAGLSCSPCLSAYNHRKSSCKDPKCMKAITVAEVFGAVSAAVNRPVKGK
jgi:ADP-heptose:LPS heptosyltransferase